METYLNTYARHTGTTRIRDAASDALSRGNTSNSSTRRSLCVST
jgi:hypothetical protein